MNFFPGDAETAEFSDFFTAFSKGISSGPENRDPSISLCKHREALYTFWSFLATSGPENRDASISYEFFMQTYENAIENSIIFGDIRSQYHIKYHIISGFSARGQHHISQYQYHIMCKYAYVDCSLQPLCSTIAAFRASPCVLVAMNVA